MRARLELTIGLLACAALATCSRESAQPASTAPPASADEDLEPQDLEPVDAAGDPDPLLVDVDAAFSMVCVPSFSRAYSVALVRPDDDLPAGDHNSWSVRFAADEASERFPSGKGGDPQHITTARLDEQSAQALQQAWESVVRRTRYPRPHYAYWQVGEKVERLESSRRGYDGETYRFEYGKYRGKTWSPKAELTRGIVELGDALRSYALADEAIRPKKLAHCLELARKLQAAAEKRPW